MKKKTTIWTYFKRFLLIIIAFVVVIFVSVYFLGKYKAAGMTFNNEYPDDYWDNLEEKGFVSYNDIITERDSSNIRNTQKYIPPYNENDDYVVQLKTARYEEELQGIYERIKALPEYSSYHDKDLFEQTYEELSEKYLGYKWNNYTEDEFTNKKVLENDRFVLYLNMINTEFKLCEKDENGEIIHTWNSNPSKIDTATGVNKLQQSLLSVTFVDGSKTSSKTPITYDSYTYGTEVSTNKQKNPSFYVNVITDEAGNPQKVQVYYALEKKGIDYDWFPQKITKDRLQELFDRCNAAVAEYKAEHNGEFEKDSRGYDIEGMGFAAQHDALGLSSRTKNFYNQVIDNIFKISQDGTYYTIDKYENMSDVSISNLYRFFYEWCKYTTDDLLLDTENSNNVNIKPKIEIVIEYALNENGLEVLIPGNSVKTNKNQNGDSYMVTGITVLPYFTSVKYNEEQGYMVIPDGSGAVMNFDNGKSNYMAYSKRIYSTDLSFTSYTLTTSTNDLMFPMYAYVLTEETETKKPTAVIVEVTEGAAQVRLSADTSNRAGNSFNYANYSIVFREQQRIVIGTTQYNRTSSIQYTQQAASGDYRFNYNYLDSSEYEISYSGVAKFYRDLLLSRSHTKININGDTTDKAVLDLEILGSYSYKDNFLGIGYTAKDSLTTVDQLQTIIDEILNIGISGANIYYHGWRSEGLKNVSFKNISVSNEIGGKKKLLKLINEYNSKNISIYPQLEFLEYQKFQESFGRSHYTARDVGGSYSTKYPYELNSNVFNKKADEIMVLSPAYYTAFATTLAKEYSKTLGIQTLSLTGLGSQLSGNYRKNKTIFKSGAVEEQIESFDILYENGINQLALKAPYYYALEFVSNAYDVPYQSTQYEILDYSIPFYQLVVNGLFDYSGESINANVEKGLQEHLMKCIETGSNPAFTFTYDDSSELLLTDYNSYYYTLYTRWLSDVENICDTLNELNIYSCRLAKHERLDENVYKVTYMNDTTATKIEIVLNYQRINWTYENGVVIPAKSYKIV